MNLSPSGYARLNMRLLYSGGYGGIGNHFFLLYALLACLLVVRTDLYGISCNAAVPGIFSSGGVQIQFI